MDGVLRPVSTSDEESAVMNIDKSEIVQLLRQRNHPQADEAERELPDQLDTEQDTDLLRKYGLDPQELLGKLAGGFGNL
jgi:hypothetical protein